MKKSRVYILATLLMFLFCTLLYKLADIQLLSTENYGPNQINLLSESVNQRASDILLANGRGTFLDRNEQPINHRETKDIVISPFITTLELPENIAMVFNSMEKDWLDFIKESEKPLYLSEITTKPISDTLFDMVEKENFPGILTVERTVEKEETLASHLIGIVRNNEEEFSKRYSDNNKQPVQPIGISGLEKAFDSFLLSENEEKSLYHVDGIGNPLLGMNLRYQGQGDFFYPIKVQTTIDSKIQALAERVIDEHHLEKGGLVILDIQSRDILAMVSRPHIEYQNPYANNALKNQLLTTHFPGSVFKTVIAAAAIENSNSLEREFDCNLNVYGDGSAERQLGMLSFSESFAKSCNYTFASLAIELLAENETIVEDYADKLGIIEPVGWTGDIFHFNQFRQLPEEEVGVVWKDTYDRNVERAIAQTSIGQKDVKITPLAIANMMATIADEGVKKEVRAVQKLLYNNNTTMAEFKPNELSGDTIKQATAIELKRLMTEVVTNGTGNRLQGLQVAGKSGTAETGKDGKYHHWFAGFFPVDNPKFAMVIVDLDQSSEHAKTYDVFYDVTSKLLS